MYRQPGRVRHSALVDGLIFPREFVTAARRTAADEVARWEARLANDEDVIRRLALELRGVRTQREQKEYAARMLRELADGWALTETFVDQMRRKTRDLDT